MGDPDAWDANGNTALSVACFWGAICCVFEAALMRCAGHAEVAEALLEIRANPDRLDGYGNSPRQIAEVLAQRVTKAQYYRATARGVGPDKHISDCTGRLPRTVT